MSDSKKEEREHAGDCFCDKCIFTAFNNRARQYEIEKMEKNPAFIELKNRVEKIEKILRGE